MAEIRFESTREIIGYWEAAKTDVYAPVRSDIRPDGMAKLLPRVFIVGEEKLKWIFRLAGTELYGVYGAELTGRPLSYMWGGENVRVTASLRRAGGISRPLLVHSMSSGAEGEVFTETVMLPMRSSRDFADVDRFLGLQSFSRPKPWWLGNMPVTGARIVAMDVVQDLENAGAAEKRGRETPVISLSGVVKPRLRVIEGGRLDQPAG